MNETMGTSFCLFISYLLIDRAGSVPGVTFLNMGCYNFFFVVILLACVRA